MRTNIFTRIIANGRKPKDTWAAILTELKNHIVADPDGTKVSGFGAFRKTWDGEKWRVDFEAIPELIAEITTQEADKFDSQSYPEQ